MRLVVVGATGAVGTEILKILGQRNFPMSDVVPVASARSAGRRLPFGGGHIEVVALEDAVFESADICLFDVPDDVAREWGPRAAAAGAVIVDNSGAWRMEDAVPLVVPEINPEAAADRPLGIISSPNCTTLAMVVPLAVLHARAGLERLIVASYQATSGAGKPGVDELWDQTQTAAKEGELVRAGLAREVLTAGAAFSAPIALNVLPQAGSFKPGGFTSEELKLCHETRKILGLPELRVTATCVRVPVVTGHGVAVHAEFFQPLGPDEARSVLEGAAGVKVVDDPETLSYPTPLEAAGRDPCFVGRIRQDPFDVRGLELFCVADNLRKGAALNAVQIAELLLPEWS